MPYLLGHLMHFIMKKLTERAFFKKNGRFYYCSLRYHLQLQKSCSTFYLNDCAVSSHFSLHGGHVNSTAYFDTTFKPTYEETMTWQWCVGEQANSHKKNFFKVLSLPSRYPVFCKKYESINERWSNSLIWIWNT